MRSTWLLAVAIALCLPFWRPVSWLSTGTLEWRYPAAQVPQHDADAIVVLSGADSTARYEHAAWLYTHWRQLPVLACTGGAHSSGARTACVSLARRILTHGGVPPGRIWIEDRSANTHENAVYAARVLGSKGMRSIVLVTEAFHMLRAELCFRGQGIHVIPAPCRYRAGGFLPSFSWLLPSRHSLRETEAAAHEWFGIAWYLYKGYL